MPTEFEFGDNVLVTSASGTFGSSICEGFESADTSF